MRSVKLAGVVGIFSGALLMTACADSSSSLNPTAPSAVVGRDDVSKADAGAVSGTMGGKPANPGNGNGNGGGKPDNPGNGNGGGKPDDPGNGNGNGGGKPDAPGNGNGNGGGNPHSDEPSVPPSGNPPTDSTPGNSSHTKVEIEGLIASISASQVSVRGQTVAVTGGTVIRREETALSLGDLEVGDRVHVRATRITTGGTTSLEAMEIKLQEEEEAEEPTGALVAVVAVDATAKEGAASDTAIFLFTRSGDTTAELTIAITLSGTATNGTDYEMLASTVTFEAGLATASVEVVAKADAVADAGETVIVTVMDGTGYSAGAPALATVGIAE